MKENIKVLEELINGAKEFNQYNGNKYYKAIENLIVDNKRLDKENKALFEAYNFNDTNLLARILKEYRKEILNSIPKSKVREKIEEINKEKLNYWVEQGMKEYAIDCMQELLQEGDDK